MAKELTPKLRRFCHEYVVDYNGKQAAIRAGYSPKTAGAQASDILTRPTVRKYMQQLQDDTAKRLGINKDSIVKKWWDTANTDVNEIIQYRRGCCRHCWGIGHRYQWTEAEYNRAFQEAFEKGAPVPECVGGMGYQHTREPAPDCPECAGEGVGRVHLNDTRKLRGPAAFAYNGVQVGKDGIKVNILDRDKALDNIAKHLGMFQEQVKHSVDDDLADILNRIAQQPRRLPSEDANGPTR